MELEKYGIAKLKGANYGVWKAQLEASLMAKGLSGALRGVVVEDEQAISTDEKARAHIILSVDSKYVQMILSLGTAKEMWERLAAMHVESSSAGCMAIQEQFFSIRMGPNEKVNDYVARVESLASMMKSAGCEQSEKNIIGKIISRLPSSYQSFRSAWIGTPVDQQTRNCLLYTSPSPRD